MRRGLTAVELEVLQGAAEGETTADTAARVCRAFTTVQRHRKHILWKLHARNMTQAVAIGYRTGTLGRGKS